MSKKLEFFCSGLCLFMPVNTSGSTATVSYISICVHWHKAILDKKFLDFFLPPYSRGERNIWTKLRLKLGPFVLQGSIQTITTSWLRARTEPRSCKCLERGRNLKKTELFGEKRPFCFQSHQSRATQ